MQLNKCSVVFIDAIPQYLLIYLADIGNRGRWDNGWNFLNFGMSLWGTFWVLSQEGFFACIFIKNGLENGSRHGTE